jgi:hypothetical protein
VLALFISSCSAFRSGSDATCVALPNGVSAAVDAGAFDAGTWDGGPTDVALAVTSVPRFSISVQIGDGGPIAAWLDTGSSGLRILAGAVPDTAYDSISPIPVSASYSSGVSLEGVVAFAYVTIGDRVTPHAIPVELIQRSGCTGSHPECKSGADFLAPFQAILGVGMRNGISTPVIGNPIVQLPGGPAYIVEAPSFGGTSGNLRIGPSDSEAAGFQVQQMVPEADDLPLPNGTLAWNDEAFPACLSNASNGAVFCANSLLDTGTPATRLQVAPTLAQTFAGGVGVTGWSQGTGLAFVVPSGAGVSVALGYCGETNDYAFTVGMDPTPGLDEVELVESTGPGDLLNLGTAVFFRYDVLFDQAHGFVGLRTR